MQCSTHPGRPAISQCSCGSGLCKTCFMAARPAKCLGCARDKTAEAIADLIVYTLIAIALFTVTHLWIAPWMAGDGRASTLLEEIGIAAIPFGWWAISLVWPGIYWGFLFTIPALLIRLILSGFIGLVVMPLFFAYKILVLVRSRKIENRVKMRTAEYDVVIDEPLFPDQRTSKA